MSRRADDTVVLCCPLTEAEQDYTAEMMRQTGITSEANLVRVALYRLALHLKVPVTVHTFAVRTTHGRNHIKRHRLAAKQLTIEEMA